MTTAAPATRDSLHAEFYVSADGTVFSRGLTSAVLYALDARLRSIAVLAGAEEHTYPTVVAEQTLNRAEYFKSFATYASRVESPGRTESYFLSPAVCYHSYQQLAHSQQVEPVLITCCGKCFRGDPRDGAHLWEFTMREIVFLGSPGFVHAQREFWMGKTQKMAHELGLECSLLPANDPFFGTENRGKKLLQQLKQLKYELSTQGPSGAMMAIASFNLHEQFFGSRFNIMLENGEPACSGCAAFGLERWIMALLARHSASEVLKRLEGLQ